MATTAQNAIKSIMMRTTSEYKTLAHENRTTLRLAYLGRLHIGGFLHRFSI